MLKFRAQQQEITNLRRLIEERDETTNSTPEKK